MVMRRNWLPKPGSPRRPIHTKLMQLGGQVASIFATLVTPWIAIRFGWRAVNTLMGGGGLVCCALWFWGAVDEPMQFLRTRKGGAAKSGSSAAAGLHVPPPHPAAAAELAQRRAPRTFNFAIFRDPAVLAALWCKMANGNLGYTMSSYTPTIFIESLGCTSLQTARYLLWLTPVSLLGGFAVAALEGALLKRGVGQLKIRKWAQAFAAAGQSVFAVAFGFCTSAPLAALCINAENVCSLGVQAGFNQNMIEVGRRGSSQGHMLWHTLIEPSLPMRTVDTI